jgi:hypothetical protein
MTEQMQVLQLTLTNGKTVKFTGPVQMDESEPVGVTSIKVQNVDLPEGFEFETLDNTVRKSNEKDSSKN